MQKYSLERIFRQENIKLRSATPTLHVQIKAFHEGVALGIAHAFKLEADVKDGEFEQGDAAGFASCCQGTSPIAAGSQPSHSASVQPISRSNCSA
jgi:hypothetical protein